MSIVTLVRSEKDNSPKISKEGRFIFCKDGVYFTLDLDETKQILKLIEQNE